MDLGMQDIDTKDGDFELEDDNDEDFDHKKHENLLDSISALDGRRRSKNNQRTIPVTKVNEFNFKKRGEKSKIKVSDLVTSLTDSSKHGELKKQLGVLRSGNKTVETPLPKHSKESLLRSVAYETTKKEVDKWGPVIQENRKAEQIIFPLERPDIRLSADDFVKRFQPTTPLEQEIAALLSGSDHVVDKDSMLTRAEEKMLQKMNIEEAKQRRTELQKYRVLLSYKEAKCRRQKKIKSKSYHRILRKDKAKKQQKMLEELQKTDPEAYMAQLELLEKTRVQERMSLKHKQGGKFYQRQKIYGKFNEQGRLALQDMYHKNKELTQKMKLAESDDEDTIMNTGLPSNNSETIPVTNDVNNPWMSAPSVIKKSEYARPEAITNTDAINAGLVESSDEETEESVVVPSNSNVKYLSSDNSTNLLRADKLLAQSTETNKKSSSSRVKNSANSPSKMTHSTESKEIIDKIFEVSPKRKSKETKKKKKKNNIAGKVLGSKSEKVRDSLTCEKKSKKKKQKQAIDKNLETSDLKISHSVDDDSDDDIEDGGISENLTRKRTLAEVADIDSSDNEEIVIKKPPKKTKVSDSSKHKSDEPFVDPKKLFTLENKIQYSQDPDLEDDDENTDISPVERQRLTMAQAFADDDVIEEFSKEKEDAVDKERVKDISMLLPGWGNWAGVGLKPPKKKVARFTIKAPRQRPRKDELLGNVIISEQKDKHIAKLQVKNVPYPFANRKQFEDSIKAPIGKNWQTERAFRKLIKPKVFTRRGQIIKPIDKSTVFEKQNLGGEHSDIGFNKSKKPNSGSQEKTQAAKRSKIQKHKNKR